MIDTCVDEESGPERDRAVKEVKEAQQKLLKTPPTFGELQMLRILNIEQRIDALEKSMAMHERCGFCGKCKDQVKTILVGPAASICNECVAVCLKTVGELMAQSVEHAVKKPEPIHQENGKWYFWDETDEQCGPYESRAEAEKQLKAYCEALNGEPKRKPASPFQMWLDGWCLKNLDCNLCAITGDTCAVAGSSIKKLLDAVENFITVPNANGDMFTSSPKPASADSEWCPDCQATHPKQAHKTEWVTDFRLEKMPEQLKDVQIKDLGDLVLELQQECTEQRNHADKMEANLKKAVKYLREGKRKFMPTTTNSDVDEFLKDHEWVTEP